MTLELLLFNFFIALLIIVDLSLFSKKNEPLSVKKALIMSCFWIFLSLLFNLFIYFLKGREPALQFFTAYLVEKSLSIDNLFVFIYIFKYFHIPEKYQHKVLMWGIIGAFIMRALFIFLGIKLIEEFHFILYFLALFLILIAIKIIFGLDKEIVPQNNPVLKLAKKIFPVTHQLENHQFFVKNPFPTKPHALSQKFAMTPLFIALLMIETTDLLFAIDSIPAVLGITTDPFIAYTSNILAVMGLRSLYFALSSLLPKFIYLHTGIGIILGFVGIKMLVQDYYKIDTLTSLLFIVSVIICSILFSKIHAKYRK